MTQYLIEFRFQGKAKHNFKRFIWHIDYKFRLNRARRIRPVPHITLVGPFTTNNEKRLIEDFSKLCSETKIIHFYVDGFGCFDNANVVYINIIPSEELEQLRNSLLGKLQKYCDLRDYENLKEYQFHSTLAMKVPLEKYNSIKNYVYANNPPKFEYVLARLTLVKNRYILREYDFMQRKLLMRWEAKNKSNWGTTMNLIKDHQSGNFDPDSDRITEQDLVSEKSLWDKIKSFFGV